MQNEAYFALDNAILSNFDLVFTVAYGQKYVKATLFSISCFEEYPPIPCTTALSLCCRLSS